MVGGISHVDHETDHFRVLLELAYALPGSLDIGDVLTHSLEATRKLIHFRGGSISLIEDGLLAIAVSDPPVSPEVAALKLPVGTGLSGRVAATGTPVYSPDLDTDARVDPEVRRLGSNQGIRSYFAVPVVASGEIVGVLQIDSEEPAAFSEEQRSMVATLAPLMGSAIQNARIFTTEQENQVRARELEQVRSDFLSITTHELRTPLAPLIGFAELLTRPEARDVMGVDEITRRMLKALERMEYLVARMRRAASAGSGAPRAQPEPADIGDAVELVVAQVGDRRPIDVSFAPGRPRANIDVARLTDALMELLDNAINFSPEGSGVSIDVEEAEGGITITVVDEGPGIAPEDAERIFEPFAQLEDPQTRAIGGLGIGLVMARSLIREMGGDLRVVPGPHGRFEITLEPTDD
jgi:signal transduction histidine kinase